MTLIHAQDRTYALPDEPTQCGACGAMSGFFVNWRGETFCARCQFEPNHREAQPCDMHKTRQ